VTLVELIIVLAIIATMLGLLLPAVQLSRERAREAVCKNNLHQISLALAQLHQTMNEFPRPAAPGNTGGWSVEILPFLEQRPLYDELRGNIPLGAIPPNAIARPWAMRCPLSKVDRSNAPPIQAAHFVLTPTARRDSWWLLDAPNGFQQPWIVGPEMSYAEITSQLGPHHRGFHVSGSDGAVRLLISGATVH
jgi:hypothetical protein